MSLLPTDPPAMEPISLAEAKAHLRVEHADEDMQIQSFITTSRLQIEGALGLAMIEQKWSVFLDTWPRSGTVTLPLHPVQSLDAIRLHDGGGGVTDLPISAFYLDGAVGNARISLPRRHALPSPGRGASGIEIAITAGFGPDRDDVPNPIRHALLLLVAHWYENREPNDSNTEKTRIPQSVSDLLAPYKPVRL